MMTDASNNLRVIELLRHGRYCRHNQTEEMRALVAQRYCSGLASQREAAPL